LAVRTSLRPHAEVDKVIPIKRGQQKSDRQAKVGEELVCFALGVKMRHLILVHQGRHAIIAQRHPSTGIFQRRPDDVPEAGALRRPGHRFGLGALFFGREMRPKKGYAICPVSTFKGSFQTLLVIDIGRNDFSA